MLRLNYEELVAAAFGSHNPDAPLPLCVPPMKTNPMQHYLEQDLIQRLGFDDDVFISGSFQMSTEDSKIEDSKSAPSQKKMVAPTQPKVPAGGDEEEETKGLERGQI